MSKIDGKRGVKKVEDDRIFSFSVAVAEQMWRNAIVKGWSRRKRWLHQQA